MLCYRQGIKPRSLHYEIRTANLVCLSDFSGQKLVLYFYPKDNTPGCTRQACAFAAAYGEFQKRGVAVVGVSKDSAASHKRFAEKQNLPLHCCPTLNCRRYKPTASGRKRSCTGKSAWVLCAPPFLIDENGCVEKVMLKVKPDTNAQEILDALSAAEAKGGTAE